MAPVFIVSTAVIFGLIIVFHELGHFIVAKLSGMPVLEFSVGFGRPVLFSITRGETRYALRPLPLGGFVQIGGMEPGEDLPNGFDKHPLYQRALVIFAGGFMNLVLAALIFVAMGLAFGRPVGSTTRIASVLPGRPAQKVGLHVGDVIVAANGVRGKVGDLRKVIAAHPGRPLDLLIRREGQERHVRVTPAVDTEQIFEPPHEGAPPQYRERKIGVIGVSFAPITRPMGVGESIGRGFAEALSKTYLLGYLFLQTLLGRLPVEVGGPVRIVYEIGQAAHIGWASFLSLGAFLSVNVGFLNLLPFPALDGSRLVFMLVELVRRRPLDRRKEAMVHFVGLVILLTLVAVVTVHDILFLRGGQ